MIKRVTSSTSSSKFNYFFFLAILTIAPWINISRSCLTCFVTFFYSYTLESKSTIGSIVSKFQLKLKCPYWFTNIRLGNYYKNLCRKVLYIVKVFIIAYSVIGWLFWFATANIKEAWNKLHLNIISLFDTTTLSIILVSKGKRFSFFLGKASEYWD